MISFTLPLEPVAWERVKRGRQGQAYVPFKTRSFKRHVAAFAWEHTPVPLLDGPLRLTAQFFVARPKKCRRKYPAVRPDLDNFMKALKDGLNGVIWTDDSRVCAYGDGTGKFYCAPGTNPRIEIQVEEMK